MIVGPPARDRAVGARPSGGRTRIHGLQARSPTLRLIAMISLGWLGNGIRKPFASTFRKRHSRRCANRAVSLRLETLETIELLSSASSVAKALHLSQVTVQSLPFNAQTIAVNTVHASATQTTATTTVQTVTVPNKLTNFSQPFTPPISLFNPSLGTLVAVHITASATLTSQIQSENTSTTSGAQITGFTNGTFTITGLGTPITGNLNGTTTTYNATSFDGNVDYMGPSGVTFPPLATTQSSSATITDPTQLAYFVSSAGRTTITPVLTDQAQSGANAPNGNLQTNVMTSGSGTVTITYEYSAQLPTVVSLQRFGIHHQPTVLVLTFAAPLTDTASASNPANYVVIQPNAQGSFTGPGIKVIPIVSATLNGTDTAVTLLPAQSLNYHKVYQLKVTLPQNNNNPLLIEFGGKSSLAGFSFHGKQYVVINGKPIQI